MAVRILTNLSLCMLSMLRCSRTQDHKRRAPKFAGPRLVCMCTCWAEAHIKIARMTLTIKLDRNWSSFQLANSAPPLSVTDSAIAPSARIHGLGAQPLPKVWDIDVGALLSTALRTALRHFRCTSTYHSTRTPLLSESLWPRLGRWRLSMEEKR